MNTRLGTGVNYSRRMRNCMVANRGRWLSPKEVATETARPHYSTSKFLIRFARLGLLDKKEGLGGRSGKHRIVFYRLRKGDLRIRQIAKGEVVALVWKVMRRAKRPLRQSEVRRRVNSYYGKRFTKDNINNCFNPWFRSGSIRRLGRGIYLLRRGMAERPPATRPS